MEKIFTNELGNRITVRIEHAEPVQGVAQLTLTMIGPTSMIENTITLAEADVLRDVLTAFRHPIS